MRPALGIIIPGYIFPSLPSRGIAGDRLLAKLQGGREKGIWSRSRPVFPLEGEIRLKRDLCWEDSP